MFGGLFVVCHLSKHFSAVHSIANLQLCTAHIPGYVFEYVPTPLASEGVGMFIDESLEYRVLDIVGLVFQSE